MSRPETVVTVAYSDRFGPFTSDELAVGRHQVACDSPLLRLLKRARRKYWRSVVLPELHKQQPEMEQPKKLGISRNAEADLTPSNGSSNRCNSAHLLVFLARRVRDRLTAAESRKNGGVESIPTCESSRASPTKADTSSAFAERGLYRNMVLADVRRRDTRRRRRSVVLRRVQPSTVDDPTAPPMLPRIAAGHDEAMDEEYQLALTANELPFLKFYD